MWLKQLHQLPMTGNGKFIPPKIADAWGMVQMALPRSGGRTVCSESDPAGRESGAIPQRRSGDVRLR